MKQINFTKSQVEEILKEYYGSLGRKVDINIYTGSSEDFYSRTAYTTITLIENISIGNQTMQSKTMLIKDDLIQIFNSLLKERGLEVTDINYLDGIRCEEYFCNSYDKPYFNGIEVNVKEKIKNGKEKINMEERKLENIEKALYVIDMNNGFVNFGAMANPSYNALIPEQLRTIEKVRNDGGIVNFILEGHDENAVEFKNYPRHCVLGTEEAELVPELKVEQNKPNTYTYYKNSINGMLNHDVRENIKRLKALKEVIFEGVCADLCVMDFARTYARYLDEINKEVKLFVLKNTIDTFSAPGHDRDEWLDISYKVMAQAGINVVENLDELNEKEKTLGLK